MPTLLFTHIRPRRIRWALVLMLVMALSVGASTAHPQPAAAQPVPTDGIICTNSGSPNAAFTLTTQTGYVGTPDDNVVFSWGFALSGSPFQYPSPVLCVSEGDAVTIILNNTLSEDISLVFPGQQNVLANGAPSEPQFSGSTVTSLAPVAAPGGSMSYSFVASEPGTYIYESGTNPMKQVNMGLFGVLIVRPSRGAGYAYNTDNSKFTADKEFMVLLSEIDPMLNRAVERGRPFNFNNYRPRYFMLNGRGFPDSIAPNNASWLPSQPYGSLVRVNPNDASNPDPALIRYVNVTGQDMPFHPHGYNGRVIGRDGRPLVDGSADISFEKYSVNIGPGQTWDVTAEWRDAEQYVENTNAVPVVIPNAQNIAYGEFYSGSPYLGIPGAIPVGAPNQNQCGEYYIISHNHSLFQITSWGIPMTGPITYLRVDPPLPNNCP